MLNQHCSKCWTMLIQHVERGTQSSCVNKNSTSLKTRPILVRINLPCIYIQQFGTGMSFLSALPGNSPRDYKGDSMKHAVHMNMDKTKVSDDKTAHVPKNICTNI